MTKYTDIAQRFVREQLQIRDDIVAILLVGSAASGETTDYSDIDLRLIVEGKEDAKLTREGLDCWIDGIYVDATFAAGNRYTDVETILSDRGSADTMNFGFILYDALGQLSTLQKEVQAQFMQPKWVHLRVKPAVDLVSERIDALCEAIDASDSLHINIHAGRVFAGLGFIPLLQRGTAVSSSRSMIQLNRVEQELALRLQEVEGATKMGIDDTLSALAVSARLSALDPASEIQELRGYMVGKANWMARNGYHREAIHTGWLHSSNRAIGCERSGEPTTITEATELAQEWLQAVGWVGDRLLLHKLNSVVAIWEKVQPTLFSSD